MTLDRQEYMDKARDILDELVTLQMENSYLDDLEGSYLMDKSLVTKEEIRESTLKVDEMQKDILSMMEEFLMYAAPKEKVNVNMQGFPVIVND